jgi:DNA modification methylase
LTSFPVWIIWGGNYYASLLGDCVAPLVWDKKTGKNYFADGELAFTSFKSGTLRIFHHQWCGFIKASEKGEALQYSTQKPVALMKWCIEQIKPRPKLICDPLMGSGTTGVACIEMGIKFIGIEKRENAFELALRRLFGAKKILGGFNKNLGLLDDIE